MCDNVNQGQKLNFQTEKHPYVDVGHQNGSPEVNKAGSRD